MSKIKILRLNPYTMIPVKSSTHAVGFDIYCNFYDLAKVSYEESKSKQNFEEFITQFSVTIEPQTSIALPTGLTVELPYDMEMDIKSRSGLFIKNGILAQGTIDPDYRGEIKIMLFNLSTQSFTITHKERVAQALFRTVHNSDTLFEEVKSIEDLSNTKRDNKGFGSTGIL